MCEKLKVELLKEDLINDPEVYEENHEYFDPFFIYEKDKEQELTVLLHSSITFGLVFKDKGIWKKFFDNKGTHYSVKDTNYKDSLTIHFEKESPSGTEPIDLVGSYISRLDWTLEQNKPLIVENMGIRYMKYENSDSSTASVALTNAPTQRSNYIYNGIYSVIWDKGGSEQETLSNVIAAKFRSTHEIYGSIANASSGYDAKKQLYPTGTYTHLLQIDLVTSSENQIDNLVNMDEFDIEIICRKTYPDGSKSLTFNIADASVIGITQPITLNLSDFAIQSIQLEYNNLTIDYYEE